MAGSAADPGGQSAPYPVLYSVYGKPIVASRGPIVPHSEHNITSRLSPSTPATGELQAYSHPNRLFQERSTRTIVATDAMRHGAFFILPAAAGGQNYMLAGRIRPRPERGEDQPGRRYTQMNLFAFQVEDWQQNSPQLLAQVPRWLQAEPDLADPGQRRRQHQQIRQRVADCRDRPLPLDAHSPLPADDSPANRLLLCLQNTQALVSGWTELAGHPAQEQEARFLAAAAQLLFLLPDQLRPLISFSYGFTDLHPGFSLQWLPGRSEQTSAQCDPGARPSLLSGWRKAYQLESIADWRQHLAKQAQQARLDRDTLPPLSIHRANTELQGLLGHFQEAMAVSALFDYLANGQKLPPMAAQPAGFRALTLVSIAAILQTCPAPKNPGLVARALGLITRTGDQDWAQTWRLLLDQPPTVNAPAAGDWRTRDRDRTDLGVEQSLERLHEQWHSQQAKVPGWQPPDSVRGLDDCLRLLSVLCPTDIEPTTAYSRIGDFEQFKRLNEWVSHYQAHRPPLVDLPDKLLNRAYATHLIELAEHAAELLSRDPEQLGLVVDSDPRVLKMTRAEALADTRALLLDIAATSRNPYARQYSLWPRNAATLLERAFDLSPVQIEQSIAALRPLAALQRIATHYRRSLQQVNSTPAVQAYWREQLLQRLNSYRGHLASRDELYPAVDDYRRPKAFLAPLIDLLNIDDDELSRKILGYFSRTDLPDEQRAAAEADSLLAVIRATPQFLPDVHRGHRHVLTALATCLDDLDAVPDTLFDGYLDTIALLAKPKKPLSALMKVSAVLLTSLSGADEHKQAQAIKLLRVIEDQPNIHRYLTENPDSGYRTAIDAVFQSSYLSADEQQVYDAIHSSWQADADYRR
jgi:hypothetical protein